jgi:hypothetical protein
MKDHGETTQCVRQQKITPLKNNNNYKMVPKG